MTVQQDEANADTASGRKAWIDPSLHEFDVETVTEAAGPGAIDGGFFS